MDGRSHAWNTSRVRHATTVGVGVYLVGGLVGTPGIGPIATAATRTGVDGLFYGGGADQLWRQMLGSGAVLVYAFVVSGIIGLVDDKTMGFRIDEEHEVSGIDLVVHAETAYDLHAIAGARSTGGLIGTHREENPNEADHLGRTQVGGSSGRSGGRRVDRDDRQRGQRLGGEGPRSTGRGRHRLVQVGSRSRCDATDDRGRSRPRRGSGGGYSIVRVRSNDRDDAAI